MYVLLVAAEHTFPISIQFYKFSDFVFSLLIHCPTFTILTELTVIGVSSHCCIPPVIFMVCVILAVAAVRGFPLQSALTKTVTATRKTCLSFPGVACHTQYPWKQENNLAKG